MNVWDEYTVDPEDSEAYVPIEDWGSDHWSTFAYVETCIANGKPFDNRRLRVNPRLHREFASVVLPSKDYPTRLQGGKEHSGHDDVSCIEDMAAAGLLRCWTRNKCALEFVVFDCMEAKAELTDLGWAVFRALTEHKNNGGNWSSFRWPTQNKE